MPGLGMSLRLVQIQKCNLCSGTVKKHEPDCLQLKIESLAARNTHLDCPVSDCGGQVGVNSDDFFECRSCNTQFSKTEFVFVSELAKPDAERTFIKDYSDDEQFLEVIVLTNKGKGDFYIDSALKELCAIRDARRST